VRKNLKIEELSFGLFCKRVKDRRGNESWTVRHGVRRGQRKKDFGRTRMDIGETGGVGAGQT
jgi:hypothetical protein